MTRRGAKASRPSGRSPSLATVALLTLLIIIGSAQPKEENQQECHKNAGPPPLEQRQQQQEQQQQQLQQQQQQEQCSLFVAPSTIPNAGLGIFTAHPLNKGDRIGDGDLMIPIIDADLYHRNLGLYWMIDDYTWDGGATGMWRESERDDGVSSFGPGLDAAINCHIALVNVGRTQPHWDEAGLHRSRDPGAGAVSQYNNASTVAKKNIPAGAELFKFYGDSWFETRPVEFGLIPLSEDYTIANLLLQRFHLKFMSSSTSNNNDVTTTSHEKRFSDQMVQSLHHLIVNLPYESRTLNAIPKNFSDITPAVADSIESLYQRSAIRTMAELQSIGRCLDNIRPGPSTLPQAGRGAFSTRFLPAGSVITGSPVFHLPTFEMLTMYEGKWNPSEYDYDMNFSSAIGHQLLLNYCWGHAESTALLCPYGAGVNYMNHNQTLANVKLQWAPHGQIAHNDTWLKYTKVSDWEEVYSTQLALDFVALRDIMPGEELFLDYGTLWENAWLRHVQEWEKHRHEMDPFDRSYQSAAQYNQLHANDTLRTVDEQHNTKPYPFNLETRCHLQTFWYFGSSKQQQQKWIETKVHWPVGELGEACQIIERVERNDSSSSSSNHEFVYTIRIIDENDEEDVPPRIARGVTRDFIIFGDLPYTTDMHLPWAFRHAMTIPDAMFPEKWKNLKKSSGSISSSSR